MVRSAALLAVLALTLAPVTAPLSSSSIRAASPRFGQLIISTPVLDTVQLTIVSRDGLSMRRLTDVPGAALGAAWAPDGRSVAFVHAHNGTRRIWIQPVDGISPRRLTALGGEETSPAWAPDGRRLAFISTHEGSPQVYVVREDGTGLRRITRSGTQRVVSWSPRGTQLAVVGTRAGGTDLRLIVLRSDGRGVRQLSVAPMLPRPGMEQPAWSPDGRAIAFVSRVGRAEQEITIVSVDGRNRRRLSTGYAPAWSPDGRRLAFVVARVGDAQIYVANADGSGSRRITRATGVFLLPAWAPDGTAIAFLAIRDGDLAVSVMNPDGSGERRLASTTGELTGLPLFAWEP